MANIPQDSALLTIAIDNTKVINTSVSLNINDQDTLVLRLLLSELEVVSASLIENIRRRATVVQSTRSNQRDPEDTGR